ncbi:ABC transporter substrate-binding protein [Leptolyngbya sp. FACHB-261]|uniref:ABC transporter substrate-binding protein n=1 Tax=Leptolyngbya sp. FACHB-261 TaxID=2692806 RepID=UPI001687A500|nr:ABC transporter substrate-binding protein [Leptolyngbya sp. FACHB-261]MBD2104889.1 ABC transporter substrate-binding protein [Leptolyngbya sp. FACHB-261]
MQSARLVRHLWLLLLALILGGYLVACAPHPLPGSQLVLSTTSDPKSFNPILGENSLEDVSLVFDGLVRLNGLTGRVEPELAESWEIDNTGKRIRFTLRDGLQWSDGQPLTADDVLFTFEDVIFNEQIPARQRDVMRIGQSNRFPALRKLNEQQIEFILPEPFAPFLVTLDAPILPKHVLENTVQNLNSNGNPQFLTTWTVETNVQQIVGSGPYRLKQYRPGERVLLERNPYYWRRTAQGAAEPLIERLVVQVMDSRDTQLLRFRSQELDFYNLRPEDFQLLKQEEERGQFTIYNGGPPPNSTWITFNQSRARNPKTGKPLVRPERSRWFRDLAFRQAVAHALDRQALVNNVFRGLGKVQDSPLAEQNPYYLAPDAGLVTYPYDLERAKAILQAAGYTYNSQGQLLDDQSNPVRFVLNTNAGNTIREAIGTQIQHDLAQIGIIVDFVPVAFNTLLEKMDVRRDWECILLSLPSSIEPNSEASFWRSDGRLHSFNQPPSTEEGTLPGYQVYPWEKQIDHLLIAAAQTYDEQERKALYGQFQQLVQEQLPVIHLGNPLTLTAVRRRVRGVKFSAIGGGLWNLPELSLVKE